MRKIILVAGPAGIGKSTFCAKYAKEHTEKPVLIVSADEVRKGMYGSYRAFPPHHDMRIVYHEMARIANEFLEHNDEATVLIDTTLLIDAWRKLFATELKPYDEIYLYMCRLHDYGLIHVRNNEREGDKRVPEQVIDDMIKGYNEPSEEVASLFTQIKDIYLD